MMMNRDWLTLAFGLALVGGVLALSLRYNMLRPAAPAPEPAAPPAAAAPPPSTPAAPPEPIPEKPTAAPATPRPKPAAPAAARTPASAAAEAETGVGLQVQSDVPGASVFLDREFVGTTPLTLRGLTPGSRQLNVSATGYEGYASTVDLTEGINRVNVEFMKVRLNAAVPVVHRHGMGSCQGTLAATPKGLSYETTNKEDAFTLAFTEVEEFDVDYLKKNLKVRRRAGRTWNFTNANADALFVFHRDVSKARERLATAR